MSAYYLETIRPYMIEHRNQIEALRDAMKAKIGGPFRKFFFDCECGANVGFHTFRFHLATHKHRKVCGDLPPPDAKKI
jgi:hypothetical protein